MQRNIKSLIGFSLEANDGEIGKVDEFYFDDSTWDIRYIILKTGGWLFGRKVLIAPQAVEKIDWDKSNFAVNLTKEKIENSPDIDTDKPVSRQQEISLYGHYDWQRYGGSGFYAGASAPFLNTPIIIDETVTGEADSNDDRKEENVHLRSTDTVISYHIYATDGEIGHVNDFIINTATWQLLYLVVDTHNFFGGKKVLIPLEEVIEIQWSASKVMVNLTMASIKDADAFNESAYNHVTSNIFSSAKN